ncbi:MAG: hypothetical protein AABY86_09675 [Bdellovibrionota bacterium]
MAQQYASLPTEANRKAVNDVNYFLENLEQSSGPAKTRLSLVRTDPE